MTGGAGRAESNYAESTIDFLKLRSLLQLLWAAVEDTNVNGMHEAFSPFVKEYLPHMFQEHNIVNLILQCDQI